MADGYLKVGSDVNLTIHASINLHKESQRSIDSDRSAQTYAPILIFCHRRPEHLRRTLESLMRCDGFESSPIIVFGDGPKNPEQIAAVEQARNVAKSLLGDRAHYQFHDTNLGLAHSIISGVTEAINRFGRAIVVEDDLFLSPHFLRYMNDGLSIYENDAKVASIHGYLYPTQDNMPDTFFLRGTSCWGWGTWARAWKFFNENGLELAQALKHQGLVRKFDLGGSYPHYRTLRGQVAGRNNSWAVRWHASAFLAGMFTLYPGRTLVENIGMDGSGEHCRQSIPTLPLSVAPVLVERIPVEENSVTRNSIIKYMRQLRWHLWRGRAKRVLFWFLPNVLGK